MDREQQQQAKAALLAAMDAGQTWQQATTQSGLTLSRSAVYRLRRAVAVHGVAALADGRHGHPATVSHALRDWLEQYCRTHPTHSSATVQAIMQREHAVTVSVSYLNKLRARRGVSRQSPPKKTVTA